MNYKWNNVTTKKGKSNKLKVTWDEEDVEKPIKLFINSRLRSQHLRRSLLSTSIPAFVTSPKPNKTFKFYLLLKTTLQNTNKDQKI